MPTALPNYTYLYPLRLIYSIHRQQFKVFRTEEFADDNFKCDENGRKIFKQVENIEGKGEIAC